MKKSKTKIVDHDDFLDNIQMFKIKINYVEDSSIVVTLGGYSKRIYFDLPFSQLEYIREYRSQYKGKMLTIYYIGNILDPFTVKILPVKSIEDIGTPY